MTLFLIVVLCVSLVGMVSLLGLKRWEMQTGRVVLSTWRPHIGALAHQALGWVEYTLPGLLRQWLAEVETFAHNFLHRLSALLVVLVERGLERLLRLLRRTTAVPRNDTEASAFLREVSAHKAELLRSARKREAIYEE